MKNLLRWILRLLFRYEAFHEEVLKTPGPVLLIPNHVSWLDWLFLGVCLDDDWKFVTSSVTAQTSWLHRRIMINSRTFPIDTNSPYAVKRMAELLQSNGRLVLFAEGRISKTGALMKLFEGTGFLLHKTHSKVITAYIRNAQRLVTSPNPNRKQWTPRITVHFSEILHPPVLKDASTSQARHQLTQWLRQSMVDQQFRIESEFAPATLLESIVATARHRMGDVILEDIQKTLSYRSLLAGTDLMADTLAPRLTRPTSHVGVLLPNVNANPVVLCALWALGRVPSLLNYSTGSSVMLQCAELAGIQQIITSRLFLQKAKLDLAPLEKAGIQILLLEDLSASITTSSKFLALLRVSINPSAVLRFPASPAQTAAILFTSGSEGVPKGVELSHRNLLSNIRQIISVCDFHDQDKVFNSLPMFHSFGLTIGTLFPLVRGIATFLYPSPLHYRIVPAAVYDRQCSIMLSTNTFLNGYARKAHPYDFRSVRYLFAGAEKVQEATATTWMKQFGIRILEGYGATECSPCVSVNTPLDPMAGSVGPILPGMEYRLEPVDGVQDAGRLLVRGPNIMKGYLNKDAQAKFAALDGWYDTGDIVRAQQGRYLFIQGRLKRFAKISGEMVSLTAVEDALAGAFPHLGLRCQVAVISKPDEDKGEKLIAATNEPKLTLEEIRNAIRARGLSNLCAPRELKVVREIPKLGTGKINHRELERLMSEG